MTGNEQAWQTFLGNLYKRQELMNQAIQHLTDVLNKLMAKAQGATAADATITSLKADVATLTKQLNDERAAVQALVAKASTIV
jgi:ABC-type transporter Mla subunit MlaD